MPDTCFCEKPTGTLVQQPINTFTNLAFCLSGCIIFIMTAYALDHPQPDDSKSVFWLYASVYGIANVFMGLGSGMYHASLAFVPQVLDNVGMYFIICWAFAYNMVRISPRRVQRNVFFSVYISMLIIFTFVNIYMPGVRRFAFFGMILGYIASEYFVDKKMRATLSTNDYQMNFKVWIAALSSIAVGFVIWILDQNGVICEPTSRFQGHGVWHVLCAAASWLLFYYYYGEKKKPALYSDVDVESSQSTEEVTALVSDNNNDDGEELTDYMPQQGLHMDQTFNIDRGYVVNNHLHLHQQMPTATPATAGAVLPYFNPNYPGVVGQYPSVPHLYPISMGPNAPHEHAVSGMYPQHQYHQHHQHRSL